MHDSKNTNPALDDDIEDAVREPVNKRATHAHMHFLILERILEDSLDRFLGAKHEVAAQAGTTFLIEGIGVCKIRFRLGTDKQFVGHIRP